MKLNTFRTWANVLSTVCVTIILVIDRGKPVTSATNLLGAFVILMGIVGVVLDVRQRRAYRRELGRSSRL